MGTVAFVEHYNSISHTSLSDLVEILEDTYFAEIIHNLASGYMALPQPLR